MMHVTLLLLVICSAVLSTSEPQIVARLFALVDKNGDGQLTESDLLIIFLNFDANHDHSITKDEFVVAWRDVLHLGNTHEADTLFGKADANHDGTIDHSDLPAIFAFFDMNGDGLINLNEFLTQWGDLRLSAPDTVDIHVDGGNP